jgi:hypothetical protein
MDRNKPGELCKIGTPKFFILHDNFSYFISAIVFPNPGRSIQQSHLLFHKAYRSLFPKYLPFSLLIAFMYKQKARKTLLPCVAALYHLIHNVFAAKVYSAFSSSKCTEQ